MSKTVSLGARISLMDRMTAGMNKVVGSLALASNASEKMNSTVKKMGTTTSSIATRSSSAMDRMGSAANRASENTKRMGEASHQASGKVIHLEDAKKRLARASETATKKTDQFRQKLNNLQTESKKTIDQLDKASGSLRNIGKAATGGGLAIGVGLGGAVKIAANFEYAMSNVKAISGATGSDFELLSAKAREMGALTSKSASQAAEALGYMALAGWDTQQMLEGIEPVLRLSEAGSLDLGRASDLVTDSMAAMRIEVAELPGYLDMVAQASRKSNTNIDALMEAFLVTGGTLASFNVPLEESTALLGVMANRGFKGAEAGTAMNAIFTNLTTPLGVSGKAMKELGISAFDSKGNFKGLEATLLELKSKLAGMTEQQQAQYVSMIAGKEHLKTFQAIMAGLGDEYQDLKADVIASDGALNDMAITMQDNLNGQITELKSAIEEAAISIGEQLTPKIKIVVGWVQKFANWFNSLSQGTKQFIAFGAAGAAGLLLVVGPIMLILAILPSVIAGIGTLVPIFGTVIAPVLGVVTAITAIGAAFTIAYKKSETIRNAIEKVKNMFKLFFMMLKGEDVGVKERAEFGINLNQFAQLETVAKNVRQWFDSIQSVIGKAEGAVSIFFSLIDGKTVGVYEKVREAGLSWEHFKTIETAANKVRMFFDIVKNLFAGNDDLAKNGLDKLFGEGTGAKVLNVMSSMKTGVSNILNSLKGAFSTAFKYISKVVEVAVLIFQTVFPIIASVVETVAPIVMGAISMIINIFQVVGSIVVWLIDNIVIPMIPIIGTIISSVWSVVGPLLELLWEAIKLVGDIVMWLVDTIVKPMIPVIETTLSAMWSASEPILDSMKQMFQWIGEKIQWAIEMVKGFGEAFNAIKDGNFSIGMPKWMGGAGVFQIHGSHATGLNHVPFDGYRAELHRGEAVLTADEADIYRKYGLGNGGGNPSKPTSFGGASNMGSTTNNSSNNSTIVMHNKIEITGSELRAMAENEDEFKETAEKLLGYIADRLDEVKANTPSINKGVLL